MSNITDVLAAVTTLSGSIDTLITKINAIKPVDTQPAIDAINAVNDKVNAITIPS